MLSRSILRYFTSVIKRLLPTNVQPNAPAATFCCSVMRVIDCLGARGRPAFVRGVPVPDDAVQ